MKRLKRLILLLLALFIIWVLAVIAPLDDFAVKPTKNTPDNLKYAPGNLEDALRQQRQIENMARQNQWRMENPTKPGSYNPHNYYVP